MTDNTKNKRIGVVGLADGWSTRQLVESVQAKTGHGMLIEPARLTLDLDTMRVRDGDVDLSDLDAIMIKKLGARYSPELLDRLELLRIVAAQGVQVFSPPASIMHALDRLTCTVTLRMADIPMPPTVVTENLAEAEAAVKRFGTAVLKPLYTSKARGMQIVEAGPQAETQLRAFQAAGNAMMYVQQLLDLPGHDFGIAFLGGEYLGAYARVQRGDSWHTAMSAGGNKYQSIEPPPEFIDLARRAQAPFNLDFTCVDVVETKAGPLVFEVSAFGGFRGLREAADIDAGGAFTDYVLQKISDDG